MTITSVGPQLDLYGPRPVAPPHSLLNTPGVVVSDDGRWLNGVNLDIYPADTPSLWEPCSEGTFRVKEEGSDFLSAAFAPFVVYVPVTCTFFSSQTIREKAQVVLEATESMGVEEGLAAGIPGSDNPYFSDANMTLLGGAAVSAAIALAWLENAIGATGRKGMIHATPASLSALNADKVERGPDGQLTTINGTPIVSGDGYINITPDGESAPGAGQDYMYATGPVEVRLGPVVVSDVASSLDRSDNTITFRAERYVLATWDTALQAGVLVDWTP